MNTSNHESTCPTNVMDDIDHHSEHTPVNEVIKNNIYIDKKGEETPIIDKQQKELKEDVINIHTLDSTQSYKNAQLLYCVIQEEEMEETCFSQNHELNKENYEMFKTIIDNFDPDDKLKEEIEEQGKLRVNDSVFGFVTRRFKKYHSQDRYATYNLKECLTNGLILIGMSLLIIGFLLLSALPIWSIEGLNEYFDNKKNNSTLLRPTEWNYANSVYFCLVTFATIGYGDMIPSTRGKVYICFFGLVGIAILGLLLVTVGKTTTGSVKTVLLLISIGIYNLIHLSQKKDALKIQKTSLTYRILFSPLIQFCYYCLFWLIYVFICAAIFMSLEVGWTYGDSLWYCFVTLGTIGYGDFYPTNQSSKIFFMFFAIIGLGFEAILIALVADIASDWIRKIKKWFRVRNRKRREKHVQQVQ